MEQHQETVAEQAGGALRHIMLVVLIAALMAMMMAVSAMPALAKVGGNGKGQGDGIGGSSPTNGSDQGVSKKDKDYQGGVYNNPHRPVVVVVDLPDFP
jgi:hypothetical protein